MDVDKWVHLNCALWSYEVYETLNGALINVDAACKRGMTLDCTFCRKKGATLGCFKLRCTNMYHVRCAKKEGVMFFQDKVSFQLRLHTVNFIDCCIKFMCFLFLQIHSLDIFINTFVVLPEVSRAERLRHTLCRPRFLGLTVMLP